MVFGTDPFLTRARKLLETSDTASLRYACLELRFALEHVAYQKLQLRLDKVTIEEINAWQPRRVMDRLMDLVDEHLSGDLVIKVDMGAPGDAKFVTLGATKGINPKDMGKHWQKVSSFLHAELPKKKGDRPMEADEQALRAYLDEVIRYVEQITSTDFDAHFTISSVTFRCEACNEGIIRNSNLLKSGDRVRCQNPNCPELYIVQKENGKFRFDRCVFQFECPSCTALNPLKPNPLLALERNELLVTNCARCGTKLEGRWTVTITPAAPV